MFIVRVVATAFLGIAVAACAGDPYTGTGPKENTGTLLGALGGALIGSQIGGGPTERLAATVAGATIGGVIGNRIGAAMDEEDKRRAFAAQIDALERGRSGEPIDWVNPDSGRRGSVVPGPAYRDRGLTCRQYTHTVYIDGRSEIMRGSACRNPDRTWTAVG